MSVISALKIIATYVVFGPPIGTLTVMLCVSLGHPSPSMATTLNEGPLLLLAGYAFGFIAAASSGIAHIYARTRFLGRSQTVALVSACGLAGNTLLFLGATWGKANWQSIAILLIAPAVVAAACVSLFLTRAQIRNAT